MFFRSKRRGTRNYLQIVESVWEQGRSRQRVLVTLGRLDVLPVDDLGVRAAIKDLYGLDRLPDKATCTAIAAPWRPYATVGSWYCWRSLDLKRNSVKIPKGYPT